MPRTIKDILPPNDYAGRLGLGLVLLLISQWMTKFEGAVFMVLRWVLLIAALVNYIIVLLLYQEQRKAKKEKEKE